ncbi:MAG: S8 family serine peptidase [Verrucomicrobia bacterium]|nr:S8 family serine peptidase [Verrucomicrobiota bacterium]
MATLSSTTGNVGAPTLVKGPGINDYLDLIRLAPLLERTSGKPEIRIGLIDGPVVLDHPGLAKENIQEVPGEFSGACALSSSAACQHGTFVAGILLAKRGAAAPAICPGCTLLVRPIFRETNSGDGQMPSATPLELASAIVETINAGARILNLSASLVQQSAKGERELESALNYAARHGVIVVAAASNQAVVGSSVITRHPWVIPVAACDRQGRQLGQTNLGSSISRRRLLAPGENVTSLGPHGGTVTLGGTSVAAPFVTAAVALLWSEFPKASAGELLLAVRGTQKPNRMAIVPPLLDAWSAHQFMVRRRFIGTH